MMLAGGWTTVAWIMEAILLTALSALIFGGFCLGSYLFHLLKGNADPFGEHGLAHTAVDPKHADLGPHHRI